jgi:hypothetical protein
MNFPGIIGNQAVKMLQVNCRWQEKRFPEKPGYDFFDIQLKVIGEQFHGINDDQRHPDLTTEGLCC